LEHATFKEKLIFPLANLVADVYHGQHSTLLGCAVIKWETFATLITLVLLRIWIIHIFYVSDEDW